MKQTKSKRKNTIINNDLASIVEDMHRLKSSNASLQRQLNAIRMILADQSITYTSSRGDHQ